MLFFLQKLIEILEVKNTHGSNLKIISPGIRSKENASNDQNQIETDRYFLSRIVFDRPKLISCSDVECAKYRISYRFLSQFS